MNTAPPLRVAQLTDCHLFADAGQTMLAVQPVQTFQRVVEQVRSLSPRPDVLLLTGDLSQDETPASYARLRSAILPLERPTYWIPGNHDQPLLETDLLSQGKISAQKQFQQGGWNFVLLNSALRNEVHGALSDATLDWLEQQLQAMPAQPTLVALHHPPLPIQSLWMDEIGLKNPADFFAVVDRYPQVKLVLFGHIHQEFEAERNGVKYLGSPSTCVQFKPLSQQFAVDERSPGFRLLSLFPDGRFESDICWVNVSSG